MLALNSILLSILNIIIQATRFGLFLIIAYLFGISWKTDAFFLAQVIPATFINPLISSVQSVYVPNFTQSRIENSENIGALVASTLLIFGVISILIILIIVVLTPLGLRQFGGNLGAKGINLASQNILIMSPMVFLQIMSSVLSAAYNSNRVFILPALAEVLRYSLTTVFCFSLKAAVDITSLPIAFLFGAVIQFIILLMFWNKAKIRLKFSLRVSSSVARSFYSGIPLLFGSATLQIGSTITRFLAAQLPQGSITILDYASRLSVGMMEFLTSGVMLVVLEDWSKVAVNNFALLGVKLRKSIKTVLSLVSPFVVIIIVLRQPIVQLLLVRGNFPPDSVTLTASVMAIFIISIPLDTVGRFCVRYFLVLKNTKVIGIAAVIRSAIAILFSLILLKVLGVVAFPIADVISISSTTLILSILVTKTSRHVFSGMLPFILRLSGGVAISWIVAETLQKHFSYLQPLWVVILVSSVTIVIYLVSALWLQSSEIKQISLSIKDVVHRKK